MTPVRLRKKKLVRNPRRKGVGSRTSVAQVVERVTTQMRMVSGGCRCSAAGDPELFYHTFILSLPPMSNIKLRIHASVMCFSV